MMLCDQPQALNPDCTTTEVSGLPRSGNQVEDFRQARRELLAVIGVSTTYNAKFAKYTPGIKVTVMGSLYFDGWHNGNEPGPAEFKSDTTWEIHPVQAIERAP